MRSGQDAVRLDVARLLDGLDRDLARLRAVVAGNPGAPVPTCPQWTLADLARHVADLYQNVVVRRLYNRDGGDGVRIDGDGDLVVRLRRLLTAVTNTA